MGYPIPFDARCLLAELPQGEVGRFFFADFAALSRF